MVLFGVVAGNKDSHDLNESELTPEDLDAAIKSKENVSDEGIATMLRLVTDDLISTFISIGSK